jgi:hypothetical protein
MTSQVPEPTGASPAINGPRRLRAAPPEVYRCDRCGAVMQGVHCKLMCMRCGAMRDCSDP